MLAKRGMNEEQIAKQLNIGKGEVELILKFYRETT
jgi:transposase